MLRTRLYYGVKPLVPRRPRQILRSWLTRRRRPLVSETWPTLPGSERKPEGWPGWPKGKEFAFVLTHDVEGERGLAKCRQLAEVEAKLGFRSSFNFVPEGDYHVSRELREELVAEGFEVGVHDLRHDGKLYQGRRAFLRNAERINEYLREWGAVGFRSGFMLHNLEWLHELKVDYDLSTFDTDPFEPQPDAAGTIFPFWKCDQRGRSYVEMPYTMAQDSTLFLLMKETTPEVWLRKLDWIASHGGMALVSVHPDYLRFPGQKADSDTFPIEHYETLLRHVRDTYKDRAWNVLPKDLAEWHKENVKKPVTIPAKIELCNDGTPPRMAVVLYSYYLTDPRPRRETEALVKAGMQADVICLRKDSSEPAFETVNGVNIHRVPLKRRRSGALTYALQYGFFFLSAFWRLTLWSLNRRYRLVHVHNMPDFLVFTTIAPRLRGAKVILDLHDPMPELFCGIYGMKELHPIFRMLRTLERWSIAFADRVLTPNIAFRDLFATRNAAPAKIEIVMNSPDTTVFDEAKALAAAKTAEKRPFRMMYHGLLVERHGLDLAIDALAKLQGRIPDVELELYGEKTPYVDRILRQIDDLKLQNIVHYHGHKSQKEIAEAICRIDLGLIPNRLNEFTAINFPTRIFEYLAMGKPLIVPRTKGVQDYFREDEILFFDAENLADLAKKIEWACTHPQELAAVMARGRDVYLKHQWSAQRERLIGVVRDLLNGDGDGTVVKSIESAPRKGALPGTSAT